MKATVVAEIDVPRTARVIQVESMMDMPAAEKARREWTVDLPIETLDDWNVGLIVGPSGAGKTRIARELFGDQLIEGFPWTEAALVDDFPQGMGVREVTDALTSVGLSSAPAWVRPFSTLSVGEQFRATLARAVAEAGDEPVVVDEFTSTVDRQVAQVASLAVSKAVKRAGKKLIALSCHYDIVDWLDPDWVYQPHLGEFTGRCLRQRPVVNLEVYPVDRAVWPAFAPHHYLSGELHSNAFCVGGFVDGQCVAFYSYTHFPHNVRKNIMKGHRLVVLPDWQGLGIGGRMADWLGQFLYERGWRFHRTIAHPAVIAHCSRSPRWMLVGKGATSRQGARGGMSKGRVSSSRLLNTRTFVYVPPAGAVPPAGMSDPAPIERVGRNTLSQWRSAH